MKMQSQLGFLESKHIYSQSKVSLKALSRIQILNSNEIPVLSVNENLSLDFMAEIQKVVN